MRNFTRTLVVGASSILLVTTIMVVDIRLQTASADVIAPRTQSVPLPKPTVGFSVPVFDTALDPRETPEALDQTHNSAASSSLQFPSDAIIYSRTASNPGTPVRLVIPSIGLDADVQHLGKNTKGEMDVPSGETENVGWYKNGTVPGKKGSAVIAAHVFAAFSELENLSPGSDVYIITNKNERLHFVVEDAKEYALEQVSPQHLFNRRDAKRLNLITCAGQFIPSIDTYNRRLIVYTKLVE